MTVISKKILRDNNAYSQVFYLCLRDYLDVCSFHSFSIDPTSRNREFHARRVITNEESFPQRSVKEGERKSCAKCISSQVHGDRLLNKCDRTVPICCFC